MVPEVIERDAVPRNDPLLPARNTEKDKACFGNVFFQVFRVIRTVGSKQVHGRCVAFVIFQCEDAAHASHMRGMEVDIAAPEHIGKAIEHRIVAAGDEQRPL